MKNYEKYAEYIKNHNVRDFCTDFILPFILKREEQGKLIELPCAVGDTVWLIGKNYKKCTNHYDCEHYDYNEYLITWCEKNCPNGFRGTGVIQAIIETIKINGEQVLVQLNAHDNYLRVPITSVFLTKEAAEAKLSEMEGVE